MQVTTNKKKVGVFICLKVSFVPMFKDIDSFDENKRKLVFQFNAPHLFNFDTYDDLQTVTRDFKLFLTSIKGRKDLKHLSCYTLDDFIKIVPVPCGKCPECMNNRAKEIMFRIMQESKEHKSNYFITLTYNDDNLPLNGSLVKDEISKFNKKLKVYLNRKGLKSDFRFYGVGEYGSKGLRPHYHVIYFGLELDDLEFYSTTENGDILYTSKFLESVWSNGFVTIGEVTPQSAAYVARYTEKKKLLTKEEKKLFLDAGFVPEFSCQSMRPGIGANFYQKSVVSFLKGCYTFNVKGTSFQLPKYYRDKLKKDTDIDDDILAEYQKFLDSSFSASLSGQVLYFGKKLKKYNARDIVDRLKSKKSRNI